MHVSIADAPMARVKLPGFTAIDRQTAAARDTLALRRELLAALGGEQQLSQRDRHARCRLTMSMPRPYLAFGEDSLRRRRVPRPARREDEG